jgi:F-type H+-transporting ATPase subunit alpha
MMLRQPQYRPMPVEEQVVQIYSATPRPDGRPSWVRSYPAEDVPRYAQEMTAFLRQRHPEILAEIKTTGVLSDALKGKLDEALDAFGKVFQPSAAAE